MELNADNHPGPMNTALGICVCMLLLSAVPACAGMSAVTTPAANADAEEIWYRSDQPAARFLGGASRDTGRSVYDQEYFANSIKPSITSSGAFIQPEPAGDLDGDGADDVLVGFGSYDASKDLLLDRIDAVSGSDGTVLWSITHDVNRHICAGGAGNLDGDDKDDVLTFTIRYDSGTDIYALESISALSGKDGAVLWSKDINTDLWGVWTEFDFNGDGMDDIIVQYERYESSIETDCINEIYIFSGDGSPLWQKTPSNWVYAYPAGDLDGNGGEDLLVYSEQNFDTYWTAKIFAVQGSNGNTLWSKSASTSDCTWIYPADPAGDLNNDGKDDVVMHHERWDLPAGDCMTIYALHGKTGSEIWSDASTALDSWMNAYPAGDLTGDGKDDVLLYPWKYNPSTGRYYSDTIYAKRGYDNRLLWTKTGTDMYYMQAGDLNRDGADDLLFYERSYDASTDTYLPTAVSAVNGRDGSTLWTKTRSGGNYIDALPAGDLNRDGGGDVVVYNINYGSYDSDLGEFYVDAISAVNGSDGSALWSKSCRENTWIDTWYVGDTGDLDADGTDDVLVCTYIYNYISGRHIPTIVSAVRGEDGSVLWSKSALRGDLNFDGALSPADAVIALRLAVSGECCPDADISGDGAVTSLDAMMILQAAAGAIDSL